MNRVKSIYRVFIAAAVFISLSAGWVSAGSKYDRLLNDPDGRRKLQILALMEENRILTDDIKYSIEDPDPLIRLRSAEVLGRIDDPAGTVTFLSKLAKDTDPDVAASAVYFLGLVGYGEETSRLAVETLSSVLKEGTKDMKLLALYALGRTKSGDAAPLIKQYMTNFHSSLRAGAALSVCLLGDSTQAGSCALLLYDPAPEVAAMAAYTLGRLGYGGENIKLINLLLNDDPEVRIQAAEALGRLREEKAIEPLAAVMSSGDRIFSIKVAEALARIGDKKSAEKLEKVLSSDDSYLKTVALQGIERSENKKSFKKILPLFSDSSLMVRMAAIRAAAATGGSDARKYLLETAMNRTPYERMIALEFLGEIGNEEDLGLLTDILSSETDDLSREGAAAGLGRFENTDRFYTPAGESGISPAAALLDAAGGGDCVVAAISIEALGNTIPEQVVDDLIGIFNKSGSREDADRRLAIITVFDLIAGDKDSDARNREKIISLLKLAVADPDPRVRKASSDASSSFGSAFPPDTSRALDWNRGDLPWGEPSLPIGEKKISLITSRGRIGITLFGDDAPNIVTGILTLARDGFYDGLNFHRVVPGFVIQGGCPRGDGWGDAGYFLRSQFNMHRYGRGYVGVAHSGKDTPGSQFFITHTPQPHLDGRYTIIGKVTDGIEVVDMIETGDTFSIKIIE
ncbi:MAG: HEAT repeat domain-containing protein [Candidatus Krumholzibacteriota bacterium]|nr:HEAT repeat domain-containing protein [Candidatus Krumholzibacteriota bacterium]